MVDEDPTLIGISAAAASLGVSTSYVRSLADRGVLTTTTTQGGHRRFDPALLRIEWERFRSATPGKPAWSASYPLAGLDETRVWHELRDALARELPRNAYEILAYAVTEVVNNAIDHSGGTAVAVSAQELVGSLEVRVSDDGVGAFERMREGLGLETVEQSLVEVTKGKRTTAPDRHSGEGLFFTLRAATTASISANGFVVAADSRAGADRFAAGSSRNTGTIVTVRVELHTRTRLLDVFERFAPSGEHGDGRFTISAPRISLIARGGEFISRSEAKRFAQGLEKFEEVILDFAGVELIGQGFADELFRVWQTTHPEVRLAVDGASRGVRFMIDRARSS
ncbi:MAG: DUF4325 domain-containing protein [Protaetiibacter sp.]